jgi:hypothetical protein
MSTSLLRVQSLAHGEFTTDDQSYEHVLTVLLYHIRNEKVAAETSGKVKDVTSKNR